MWVRGLKLNRFNQLKTISWSHPMWVRGLKLVLVLLCQSLPSRTLCGCVD